MLPTVFTTTTKPLLKTFIVLGLLIAATSTLAPTSSAQTAKLKFEPQAFAAAWLLKDCPLGEPAPLQEFVDSRVELVPIFVRAFREGAPPTVRATVEAGARQAFARRKAWLAKERPAWLDAATLRALNAETVETAVGRALAALDAKYHQQALNGLALAGGPDARTALQAVAGDLESPYRQLASDGLQGLGNMP